MTIPVVAIYEDLTPKAEDYAYAETLGWRWLSYIGIPIRGTPGYPKECRVRQFFPPDEQLEEQWRSFLSEHEVQVADGVEPLSYRYCSSFGPHMVPLVRKSAK